MKNEHVKTNDLRDVFSLLLRRKWFIILPWVLVSAFVIVGVRFLTPEYESWTIVRINSQSNLSPGLQQLLGIRRSFNREGRMDKLKAIYNQLTSSAYVAKLADRLNLYEDPELTDRARKVVANNPNMTMDKARLSLLQNDLAGRINVGFAAEDQVRISVTSPEPVKARNIANALAAIYLEEQYQSELSSARSSQDFSDTQLRRYEQDLQKKIKEKTELEKEFLKVKLDESIVSETNRSDIITEIDRTKSRLEDLYTQEQALLKRLKNVSGLKVNRLKLKESQSLKEAKTQLKRGVQAIGDLVIKYTWSDPQNLNFRVR
ncbi:MAG: hypothetical protein D6800_03625 [Candidatus Zixiibacteriota bacterium]|nr:MAG: hypothetical protein D6800_03625 [candidate division Zixibacteria bacterium]